MSKHKRSHLFHLARAWISLAVILATLSFAAQAQTTNHYDADRRRAFELYEDWKLLEAKPLLEKLAERKPDDVIVLERLAAALIAEAATLKDEQAARQQRVRARKLTVRAKELGSKSNYVQVILDSMPEDGGEMKFSSRKEVDEAMREGEAAFAKDDMEKAAAAYQRALLLDPNLYEAALFIGDVHFKKKETERACNWFAQAAKIKPDRETAYRYWGDALMMASRIDEAGDKFIDAIIAEPYNRNSYVGLIQWAGRTGARLENPKIEVPVSVKNDNGQTTINIDPKSLESTDGSRHWTLYSILRAGYAAKLFSQEHPNEKVYRHSLGEESSALRAVAKAVSNDVKDGKIKSPTPSLANLVRLEEAGLIEAYVLLARPDEGIAKDYPSYREANREKLRRYLLEFVISPK